MTTYVIIAIVAYLIISWRINTLEYRVENLENPPKKELTPEEQWERWDNAMVEATDPDSPVRYTYSGAALGLADPNRSPPWMS